MDIPASAGHSPPRMKRLVLLISAALVSVNPASAADRIAVVDVKKIYQDLPSTTAVKMEIKEEQEELLRNPRVQEFYKLFQELQTLWENIALETDAEDESAKRNFAVKYDAKRLEYQAMQGEVEQFHAKRTREINIKMVTAMRLTLDRITATAQVLAREKGYDMVFDKSGETSTGVAGLVYFKDAADLTEEVFASLQLTDPAAAPEPEPAPSNGSTDPSH